MTHRNENGKLSDAFGARALDIIRNEVGHRLDLILADYRMAGDSLATASVSYDQRVGEPSGQEIQDFVIKSFGGTITPHMSTCNIHRHAQAVTLNVSLARVSRPASETNRMVPVGPRRYVEASTKEVWEIEDNDGVPALFRIAEDDLSSILDKKRTATSRVAGTRALIANLQQDGRVLAVPGANVAFYTASDGLERVGKVMGEADQHGYIPVRVTDEDHNTRIHQNQITAMLTTAELDGNTKSALQEYYAKAFGDAGYAADLVEEKSIAGTRDELVAFLVKSGAMNPTSAIAWTDTLRMVPNEIRTCGPNQMILSTYNGFGYEWQVDLERVDELVKG